jgi:two-component system nitrogen regulation sensor histidine kinase NtrY
LLVLASLIMGWRLFKRLTEPITLMLSGVDAIREQDFNVKFVRGGQLETDRLIDVYNEMIDRLRQERIRQEQQHFFLGKLIQTSPTGIIILDFDERVDTLNPKAAEILEIPAEDAIRGRLLDEIDHPVARAAAGLASDQSRTVYVQGLKTFKCRKARFIDRGFSRFFLLLEESTVEILRAEKNAYGKVIRFMAHEVNNTVGAVNSMLQALRSLATRLPAGASDDWMEALDISIERNRRLSRFMRNFADIARLPPPRRESYSLRRLLENVARLFHDFAADHDIALLVEAPEYEILASIDVLQMEQVLINAVKNASESINRDGEIRLTLRDKPIRIIISDNGPGLSPEMEEQVFSPFFSTKKDGQGIGLTLSREILVNHGFDFSLKTGPDGWTRFVLLMR